MYREIFSDFLLGLTSSVNPKPLSMFYKSNAKFKKLIWTLFKHNFLVHIVPYLIFMIITYLTNINFMSYYNIVAYPMCMFSFLFHLLHYTDLINAVCIQQKKAQTGSSMGIFSLLSTSIALTCYMLTITISSSFISYVTSDKLYYIGLILNFFILTTYHSFYAYNNLWQYIHMTMDNRIKVHELYWPYYVGYGAVASIIYSFTNNIYVFVLYNLYLIMVISIPFLTTTSYPKEVQPYPAINLSIYAYVMKRALVVLQHLHSMIVPKN